MRYSKPELLAAEVALEAIRGDKFDPSVPDSDSSDFRLTTAAYEADE